MEYYKKNAEIIYIDECTTNLWQKPGRLWIPKEHPFKVKLASNRGEGVTIIGAISSKRSKLIYFLCDGSTSANLKIFFLGLHNVINLKDKVIVLDNLAAHQNEEFRATL
jgi:predicted ABC-type transport system involved in lysophospholipase L1 biosynthesis ATPase subunit